MSSKAAGHDLGTRKGFYDIAQTIADGFGLPPRARGVSFLAAVT
jgi:phosphopentomutase